MDSYIIIDQNAKDANDAGNAGDDKGCPASRLDGERRKQGQAWAAAAVRRRRLQLGSVLPQTDLRSGGASMHSH